METKVYDTVKAYFRPACLQSKLFQCFPFYHLLLLLLPYPMGGSGRPFWAHVNVPPRTQEVVEGCLWCRSAGCDQEIRMMAWMGYI